MVFQGKVRSVAALLEAAGAAPETVPGVGTGVRHTAADNAATCRSLLAAGEDLDAGWRFGILQTVDDYTSVLRRSGPAVAARVFTAEPEPTGAVQLDAAFAALADHLAERDGWEPPAWALDPARSTEGWYPAVPVVLRAEAETDSPGAFRQRGILITTRSLDRA